MTIRPSFRNIHNRFLLNGVHYRFQDLFEIAYSFIKEGEDHEVAIGDFLMDRFIEMDNLQQAIYGKFSFSNRRSFWVKDW